MKSTEIVGSSTAMPSRRSGCSTSVTVSPISTPSSPASDDDLAGLRLLHLDAIESLEREQLRDPRLLGLLIRIERQQRDRRSPTCAVPRSMRPMPRRPRYGEWSIVEISIWNGPVCIARRRRNLSRRSSRTAATDPAAAGRVERRHAIARRHVDDRRVELRLVGLELDEEIEHLVVDAQRIGAGTIDLVDHDDRRSAERERLAQHEARLRHRTVERVDDEQHAVHHAQNALDLAAEIGVARRVDDVDLGAVPVDGGVLGENGDAALALERVGVHHSLLRRPDYLETRPPGGASCRRGSSCRDRRAR